MAMGRTEDRVIGEVVLTIDVKRFPVLYSHVFHVLNVF